MDTFDDQSLKGGVKEGGFVMQGQTGSTTTPRLTSVVMLSGKRIDLEVV